MGTTLLGGLDGLGFVLIALFVVLSLEAWRAQPDATTLAIALGAAVLAELLAPGQMLLMAFSLFTLALVIRHRLHRRTAP